MRHDRRLKLTFISTTALASQARRLLISEQHALVDGGQERVANYEFVMRCWTTGKLHAALVRSGFVGMAYSGAYDPHVEVAATDRLVAVAERMRAAA